MKKSKTQKGITLIALIITIVVLLILAIVTIGAVQESGIIGHAQNAATSFNEAQANEQAMLESYLSELNKYGGSGGSSTGNGSEEDEEVTPPVEEPDEYTLWTEAKSSNQTFSEATTGSSTNPIIPAGFIPKNTKTAKWDLASGSEADNGLVIVDSSGNEFVWVPVTTTIAAYGLNTAGEREPDVVTEVTPSVTVNSASGTNYDAMESNLNRAGCTKDLTGDNTVNAYDFKKQLENEFNLMATSVNKYGGFYAGRYETSKNGENPQSKASTADNVIETVYNSSTENDWYGLYALNKKYCTSSVQGSMMWGSQYDAMMTWIEDAANTTISDYNTNRTCGTAPADVIKNVYDLYGNSCEWTLEARYDDSRVFRGVLGDTPNYCYSNSPNSLVNGIGSRLALYIVYE